MGKRLLNILIVVFFVGFPGVGLVISWNNAHRLIRGSADPEAQKAVVAILRSNTNEELDEFGTVALRGSTAGADLANMRRELGTFVDMQSLDAERSWADQRGDMIWQFVRFKGKLKFDKGPADLTLVMARQAEHPEWRVDEFKLSPAALVTSPK
ncbi:MAG: hypothetical protein JSS66_08780 [Armatimonadetes bacterium]|nr:hypothetical protein [Armatimonadota bacterium]